MEQQELTCGDVNKIADDHDIDLGESDNETVRCAICHEPVHVIDAYPLVSPSRIIVGYICTICDAELQSLE